MSTSSQSSTLTLPNEIFYPILKTHILSPSTLLHAALSLRLVSKTINTEILHQLFTLGHIDAKLQPPEWGRGNPKRKVLNWRGEFVCRMCRGVIRAERRGRAVGKEVVRRYLVGWLGREGGTDETRHKVWRRRVWRVMRGAVEWMGGEGREFVDGDGDGDGDGDTDVQNLEEQSAHDFGEEEILLNLVDATITLFGVRDTWAYLGPHYNTCEPPGSQFPSHANDRRPAEFWALITAAYQGDLETVRYLFENGGSLSAGVMWVMARTGQLEPWSSVSMSADEEDVMLDDWSVKVPEIQEWTAPVHSIAAALTVAIRRGHRDMVNMLLGMGQARIVCCDITFWNGRTVMGTLFAATADSDPKVAQLAVDTIRRVLREWWAKGLWVKDRRWCVNHLRHALDIPTSSGILRDVLWSLLPGDCDTWLDEEIPNRLVFNLLCQAALTNDVERAKVAVEIRAASAGRVVKKIRTWLSEDAFLLNPCKAMDEFGVRPDRLLDVMNPIRISAVLSHYEILEWLLGEGWELQEKLEPWRLKVGGWTKCRTARDTSENNTMLDTRQEAVYDAFIGQGRLPAHVEPASDPKILELILRKSDGLCWARETIISAGTRNVEIFEQFVNFVDLSKQVPQKNHRVKGKLFVQGAYARTIGERSLQHALKAGRFDNAKILLMKGVKLAEAIRSDGFYHDDPEAMAILKGLQEMKLPGLSVVSRTMRVLYWVNGDIPLRLRQTKILDENEKGYVWKDGQKVKRIGEPTFPALTRR